MIALHDVFLPPSTPVCFYIGDEDPAKPADAASNPPQGPPADEAPDRGAPDASSIQPGPLCFYIGETGVAAGEADHAPDLLLRATRVACRYQSGTPRRQRAALLTVKDVERRWPLSYAVALRRVMWPPRRKRLVLWNACAKETSSGGEVS